MNYREAIDWLFSSQWFGIKLGLDGTKHLLTEFLANPSHQTQVIHVAGTNGKGSTCAMIDSIARSCGRKTGLFTSPHLIDYRERIQVSGVQIPSEDCAALLSDLRPICESMEHHPTFFEISLVLAMKWFHLQGCEVIILETGMGGRLDATTAVRADVCVITPIGLDHTQYLGETIEEIAYEKAGIIVPNHPIITPPQDSNALAIIKKEANRNRSPLTILESPLRGYHINLAGEHQQWNAAAAVAACDALKLPLNTDIIRHGLSTIQWPGRFETIRPNITIDGAHNPHSAKVLAQTWLDKHPPHSATLIFSAVAAKDVGGILAFLSPLAQHIHFCPVNTPRALTCDELVQFLPPDHPPYTSHDSLADAITAATQEKHPVLIAGSLFLIGEARAIFTNTTFQACTQ